MDFAFCGEAMMIRQAAGRIAAERHVRDARIARVCEGASEVQRPIIAREALRDLG